MRIALTTILIALVAATPCVAQYNRTGCSRLSDRASATAAEMDTLRSVIEKQRLDVETRTAPGGIRDAVIEVDEARKNLRAALTAYVVSIRRLRVHLDFCASQ